MTDIFPPVVLGPNAHATERPAHSGDGRRGQGNSQEVRQIV